jgi:hypothetical protein
MHLVYPIGAQVAGGDFLRLSTATDLDQLDRMVQPSLTFTEVSLIRPWL